MVPGTTQNKLFLSAITNVITRNSRIYLLTGAYTYSDIIIYYTVHA